MTDEESILSYVQKMIYNTNKKLLSNAKTLRTNMTKEEKHLWYDFLKRLPLTVNRQKVIGNYIVDFFIAEKRIVIELDGAQHQMAEHRITDEKRDDDLHRLGIKVLRYTNKEIHSSFAAVCEDILGHLGLCSGDLNG